ncbi:MAG: DoxX family protein [Thermoplasmata archaeon]|nr:DoxX family protein [Thermoplasmata archaeon]
MTPKKMTAHDSIPEAKQTWWVRHAHSLKTVFRILLGVVWLIDGVLKFTSGFVGSFQDNVLTAQGNAPSWLSGWYSFWAAQAGANGPLIVYTVGTLELALGLALIFGFMRKIAYAGGVILSLLIWAVPEGFGGPYQVGAGGTDVGTGVIYAVAFLGLILVNATYGPSRYSLDYYIERRFPRWAGIAELNPTGSADPARSTLRVGA